MALMIEVFALLCVMHYVYIDILRCHAARCFIAGHKLLHLRAGDCVNDNNQIVLIDYMPHTFRASMLPASRVVPVAGKQCASALSQ